MSQEQSDLLRRYLLASWVLKIRLISSRRQLWGERISLIHAESSILQIRKCCEMLAYMCLIASEIEHGIASKTLRKQYKVGLLLKTLDERKQLHFPLLARLSKKPTPETPSTGEPAAWSLQIETLNNDDKARLSRVHRRADQLLHERPPFLWWPPNSPDALATLGPLINAIRSDHQWLWNRFWQHAIFIKGALFFVDLGSNNDHTKPTIVAEDILLPIGFEVDLDPDFIADY